MAIFLSVDTTLSTHQASFQLNQDQYQNLLIVLVYRISVLLVTSLINTNSTSIPKPPNISSNDFLQTTVKKHISCTNCRIRVPGKHMVSCYQLHLMTKNWRKRKRMDSWSYTPSCTSASNLFYLSKHRCGNYILSKLWTVIKINLQGTAVISHTIDFRSSLWLAPAR